MPNFFGGLAQGLQAGDLNGAVEELVQRRMQERAARALMNTYGAQGQPPQGAPPQGAPPQGGPASLAALAPQPHPQAGPGAPPPAQPPQQPPAPPPGAPTGAPGAEAPTGMAVDSRYPDPVKEAQSLNANLWKAVKAANPKADPLTIMRAVQMQIDQIKGVAPITKSAMQGQLAMLHENIKAQEFEQRETRLWKDHADKLNLAYKSDNWKEEVAKENARFKGEMVSVAQDRARIYEESTEDQHEDRQSATSARRDIAAQGNATREDIADKGDATREDISGQRSDDSTYRSDQSFRGNQVRSGQTPDPAPQRRGGAPAKGGGVPSNVAQFAKQHGLQVIRKRADGKWDAKAKDGTVGVIG